MSDMFLYFYSFLKYDDEGVKTEKTYLIKEGKLVGRLHSRETAGKMNEIGRILEVIVIKQVCFLQLKSLI